MPELAGLFGVKFPVSDLARSRVFYERVFGLSPLFEFPDEGGVVRGAPGPPIWPRAQWHTTWCRVRSAGSSCSTTRTAPRSTSTAASRTAWTASAPRATAVPRGLNQVPARLPGPLGGQAPGRRVRRDRPAPSDLRGGAGRGQPLAHAFIAAGLALGARCAVLARNSIEYACCTSRPRRLAWCWCR